MVPPTPKTWLFQERDYLPSILPNCLSSPFWLPYTLPCRVANIHKIAWLWGCLVSCSSGPSWHTTTLQGSPQVRMKLQPPTLQDEALAYSSKIVQQQLPLPPYKTPVSLCSPFPADFYHALAPPTDRACPAWPLVRQLLVHRGLLRKLPRATLKRSRYAACS